MSDFLTAFLKNRAFELGADLVGVGNIERWANCPPRMSPAGILPSARAVVVCALHHGDAVVEIGGEQHAQKFGPYHAQNWMNDRLDTISYDVARFLEDAGYAAVPIVSSNIWRYRSYKDLTAVFSPDMSHIYAAVAAGLAELGYSGLALTPEFGPRNRFVSIITDAPLAPDPLLPGNTLCDRCGLCIKHCPARALDREVRGEVAIEIEGRKYVRANKNLWRCSWGEHFGLDLDLPIPDVVDEAVLLDNLARHGIRGGEMGQCLKHCLPPQLRQWDRAHTSSPRRKRPRASVDVPLSRGIQQKMVASMLAEAADFVAVEGPEVMAKHGIELPQFLTNAQRIMVIGVVVPANERPAEGAKVDDLAWPAQHIASKLCFYAARRLEELGYDAASYTVVEDPTVRKYIADAMGAPPAGAAFLATNAPLANGTWRADDERPAIPADLSAWVKDRAKEFGADVVGISTAGRIDKLVQQLRPVFEGERILDVRNRAPDFRPYDPEIVERRRHVHVCAEYLPGAKSVIVLGVRVPRATAGGVGQPPAEAIGPFAFAQYQAIRTLRLAAVTLVKALGRLGYRCAVSGDLTGTGSENCNPRGPQPDIFACRFEAMCAGLGAIGRGGFLLNPRFGPNLRFIAVVTDAPLAADALPDLSAIRARCNGECRECLSRCAVRAHRPEKAVEVEGQTVPFAPLEQVRCDWAKRYALVGDEGFKFLGSPVDVMPPDEITPDALADALRRHDPIIKHRMCVAEMCALACPLGK